MNVFKKIRVDYLYFFSKNFEDENACFCMHSLLPPITDDLAGVGNKDHARRHFIVWAFIDDLSR